MGWKRYSAGIFAMVLLAFWTAEAVAQDATNSPMFRDWILRRSSFTMSGGRVVGNNGAWIFGQGQVSIHGPGARASHIQRQWSCGILGLLLCPRRERQCR